MKICTIQELLHAEVLTGEEQGIERLIADYAR